MSESGLRWRTVEEEDASRLFGDEELVERHVGSGSYSSMEFLHVRARRIINRITGPARLPFSYTINAYRGCSHACTYCFARPTHSYLGLDIGRDFETKIVVKVNAAERLRAELSAPDWAGDHIAMGTNTDPYQKAEAKYHLTRGIVRCLADRTNPFSILTKSTLVLRDVDLLAAASRRAEVRVNLSIGTLDEEVWRLSEPGTPPPRKRLEAVRRLNDAGVDCGVLVAPVLPGLSDSVAQLQEIGSACAAAGATSVSTVGLHLRGELRGHYLRWLRGVRPELVELYNRRFASGAYQPAGETERISAIVRESFLAAGGREMPSFWRGATPAPRQAPRRESGPDQLHLFSD